MPDPKKLGKRSLKSGAPQDDSRLSVSAQLARSEAHQSQLWRITFFLLFTMAIFFAATSWSSSWSLAQRSAVMPVSLVILVTLFGVYAWKRTHEISELRGLVRGIEQRDAEPPSEKQLDNLFEAISRSQQGYRDLIDSFDDVLISLTLDGVIRAANRSFSDLVDTPFQDLIGKPLSDFVEDANANSNHFEKSKSKFIDQRSWADIVQVRIRGQAAVYHFDCVANAMLRGDKVQGVTVMAKNITAQHRNEARFKELFETLQEGIYITTPEGAILDVNPALMRILGYDSKEELLKKQVSDIFVDRAERKIVKSLVDAETSPTSREITLFCRDGKSIICLNTAAAVRDSSGKVLRYQGAVMDVTERRQIERRLHQQQEFARRLVDSFPDLILVINNKATYTFVSPRVKDILGFESIEVRESELGHLTHPEDRSELQDHYKQILRAEKSFASLEVRVRHKNGDWRRIRCNLSPLFDENDVIDGVVMSGRDVTDLKRLEEQLIQSEKLAAMGQMLAGVAHELNNPLTAILGVTELLRDRPDADQSSKRQLDLAHRQARRAARIVQNLLEFSQPAAPKKKALDVNSLIERTLQLHEHSLRRNAVEIDFRPQNLPEVIGDGNQLIQVFLNLIINAEQAIREVRSTGRIQVRLGRIGTRITVTIQDDGVGIRPDAFLKIFDPFYTTKRPGGGTGLGLSICIAIVKEHGGTIDAETLPAGGSAFTVYLPIAGLVSPDGATELAPPQPPVKTSPRPKSVLVLDDEESIRALLEEGLAARGLHVDCAGTVDEALARTAVHNYDVLLCDVNLSENGFAVNGKEAAKRILAAAGLNKPFLVYITGEYVEPEDASDALGAPRYLQKPFRISDVTALLQRLPEPAAVRSKT